MPARSSISRRTSQPQTGHLSQSRCTTQSHPCRGQMTALLASTGALVPESAEGTAGLAPAPLPRPAATAAAVAAAGSARARPGRQRGTSSEKPAGPVTHPCLSALPARSSTRHWRFRVTRRRACCAAPAPVAAVSPSSIVSGSKSAAPGGAAATPTSIRVSSSSTASQRLRPRPTCCTYSDCGGTDISTNLHKQ